VLAGKGGGSKSIARLRADPIDRLRASRPAVEGRITEVTGRHVDTLWVVAAKICTLIRRMFRFQAEEEGGVDIPDEDRLKLGVSRDLYRLLTSNRRSDPGWSDPLRRGNNDCG
jgi:hypothetical protein